LFLFENMSKSCKNDECSISTGIMEDLTFGSGRMTFNGFWEFPCAICARAYEVKHPDTQCWPYPGQDVSALSNEIAKECDEEDAYFRGTENDMYEEELKQFNRENKNA